MNSDSSDVGPVIFVYVGLSPLSLICNCNNSFDIWGVPIEEIALHCRVCEVLYGIVLCELWSIIEASFLQASVTVARRRCLLQQKEDLWAATNFAINNELQSSALS